MRLRIINEDFQHDITISSPSHPFSPPPPPFPISLLPLSSVLLSLNYRLIAGDTEASTTAGTLCP